MSVGDWYGTYLDPPHLCAADAMPNPLDGGNSDEAQAFLTTDGVRVAATLTVAGREVVVTHGGGIFVGPVNIVGRDGYTLAQANEDKVHASHVVNLVICEFNVRAQAICAPIAEEDLCSAIRNEDAISIWVSAGRTPGPRRARSERVARWRLAGHECPLRCCRASTGLRARHAWPSWQ